MVMSPFFLECGRRLGISAGSEISSVKVYQTLPLKKRHGEPIYRLVELNCLCLGWGQAKVMKNFVPMA